LSSELAQIAASGTKDETHLIVQDAGDLRFSDPLSIALTGFDAEQVAHRLIWQAGTWAANNPAIKHRFI